MTNTQNQQFKVEGGGVSRFFACQNIKVVG